jgi:putative spermidine/putrescine transport system ATP-binding protein
MSSRHNGVAVGLQNLTRTYGTVKALDGLTLHLEPGELVALLGPSGCGKTTALRILAGLEEPTAGTVTVDGRDVTAVPPNRRDMGMVFQAYSLFPHLTAIENVAFGLKLRGKPKAVCEARAAEMLDMMGLSAHRDKYSDQLSGGQQQRVALARALAVEPQVLLLDEPLSALDAKVRVQLRDEIRRVQSEVGTTTLFVTHDQEEALAVADRVGVMNHGRLEQIGTPVELYTTPATPFVADFVGLSNRLPARAEDGTAHVLGATLPALPGSVTGPGTALVRPEAIDVVPDPDGNAQVVGITFLGAVSRVEVQLRGGVRVTAQTSGARARSLATGMRVTARIDPAPVLVVAGR